MGALWGAAAAVGIGMSDLFSRRLVVASGAFTAALVMQVIAVLTSLSTMVVFASEVTLVDSAWGVLSGIGMCAGLASYLEGLRRSSATVVAPTTATLSALIPFLYTIVRGEEVSGLGVAGAAIALVGLAVIAAGTGRAVGVRSGFLWATASGVGYGFAISVLLEVSDDAGVWPAVPQRFTAACLLAIACVMSKQSFVPPTGYRVTGVMAGIVGGFSSVFILIGLAVDAAPAVIMTSMFPAVSVVVGFVVFGDRVARRQLVGLILVLAGSAALVS